MPSILHSLFFTEQPLCGVSLLTRLIPINQSSGSFLHVPALSNVDSCFVLCLHPLTSMSTGAALSRQCCSFQQRMATIHDQHGVSWLAMDTGMGGLCVIGIGVVNSLFLQWFLLTMVVPPATPVCLPLGWGGSSNAAAMQSVSHDDYCWINFF